MTVPATLGVDLGAEPASTAMVRIDWRSPRPHATLLPPKASDPAVLAAMKADGVVKVGIDCPFGWPKTFVDAVSAHRARQSWPGGAGAAARRLMRFRLTDREVAERFREPLSVSSTFIGVTAMRCATLLDTWEAEHGVMDRLGSGHLVEVYPALAMRPAGWDLEVAGYKDGDEWVAARREILDRISRHVDLDEEFDERIRPRGSGDDPVDALVAALIAGAAATPGGVEHPPEPGTDERRVAETEGWIAIPTIAVDAVAPRVR
jgi:hypothetical protein